MLNPESPSTAPALIDPASKAFQSLLDKLAPTEATVLIVGETGTGKEVVARYLHHHSARRQQPFLAVNCGALTESLAEAELFGHEKGAFTGAQQGQPGWFEAAEGGTLLLDEIGELSLPLQVKLLRVLQEREITRVGSRKAIKVNVRVIAATNKNLLDEVSRGTFRLDLYYRLNLISIELPPLRSRREDIPLLAAHMLAKFNARYDKECQLSPEGLRVLEEYRWPGNIRELNNFIERMVILSPSPYISEEMVRFAFSGVAESEFEIRPSEKERVLTLKEIEMNAIRQALERNGESLAGKRQAARELGISLATLYNKMNKEK